MKSENLLTLLAENFVEIVDLSDNSAADQMDALIAEIVKYYKTRDINIEIVTEDETLFRHRRLYRIGAVDATGKIIRTDYFIEIELWTDNGQVKLFSTGF